MHSVFLYICGPVTLTWADGLMHPRVDAYYVRLLVNFLTLEDTHGALDAGLLV